MVRRLKIWGGAFLLALSLSLTGIAIQARGEGFDLARLEEEQKEAKAGIPYVEVNDNIPFFSRKDMTTREFEDYASLDKEGRCGRAFANVSRETLPEEKREPIGAVKPSGWHRVKYQGIDGNYLYNRCHLIAYELAGENANERNLITGTRYMNIEGMLPFENKVRAYVEETGNHVLYRATPVFKGKNQLASGVLMEARSVEDKGEGLEFCIYCYNIQPGVTIDYATGDSRGPEYRGEKVQKKEALPAATKPEGGTETGLSEADKAQSHVEDYVVNTRTKKFHDPSCPSVGCMAKHNSMHFSGRREELLAKGYSPCKGCKP